MTRALRAYHSPTPKRSELLARYDADWVLVDRELPQPTEYLDELRLVYDGGRYALYAAPSRG